MGSLYFLANRKLQRESDYIIISKCVTENEHQSSFEDCFEAI